MTNRWVIWHGRGGGGGQFLDSFLFFYETKFLIFMYFWKLSTIDRWYSHNCFSIRNIKKFPCQITDSIVILISNPPPPLPPCTQNAHKIQCGGHLLRDNMKNWKFFWWCWISLSFLRMWHKNKCISTKLQIFIFWVVPPPPPPPLKRPRQHSGYIADGSQD